jgi:hypothetical protein
MSLAELWASYVERPLGYIGLLQSKPKRFFVFSLATAGILSVMKPQIMYDSDGKPFPNSIMSGEQNAIPFDWVSASLFVGTISILFI